MYSGIGGSGSTVSCQCCGYEKTNALVKDTTVKENGKNRPIVTETCMNAPEVELKSVENEQKRNNEVAEDSEK